MSDQSSAELEREAEAARDRVADTAESIRQKLTAGQLIDEFSDMFTGGDLSGTARNLKSQIRDNPLPVALIGAGVAWLVLGKGVSNEHFHASSNHSSTSAAWPSDPDSVGREKESGESMMASVAEGAKIAASSVSDAVSEITDSLSSTAERLGHTMRTGARHSAGALNSSISGAQHEPLLIGALGLALGAVVGAVLPMSDLEKERIGPQADRLRDGAKEVIDKGLDSAGRVASKTREALKEEADRQGLTSDEESPFAERAGNVARSAARSADAAAPEELGAKAEEGQQGT